jgi:predicted acyl esterase
MTTDHFGGRGALAGRQAPSLLQPHPALKAISEQASPADQWMNDDDHRYGALRESYAFEYAVYEQADKHANTHFAFETYDTYSWYLNLGPLSNINAKYLFGLIPFGGHDTAAEFREKIEAPWFRYWLHGSRQKFSWKASTFQTGSNTWHTYPAWPPASTPMKIYLHEDGTSRSSHPRPPTDSFSTSRIPRIPCRIGSGRFRRRIPKGTGAGGKLPISGSWRIGLTSPRGRAARSIATSPSPAR